MGKRIFWFAVSLGLAVVALLAIAELLARRNNALARAARADHGDLLYTKLAGDRGTPVVFIPGLQATSGYWQGRFDSLSDRHRVIYLDLLGFGRSPWPDADYTLDDQLEAIERTLASLDADRDVTIVAHSFGTIVAAYYAAAHPGQVRQLVLLGTPVFASEAEARKRIWDMSTLAALFSLRPLLAREGCILMGAFRPQLRRLLPRIVNDLPDEVVADSVEHFWPSIRGSIDILLDKPVEIPLQSAGSKTTLVHGGSDTVTSLARIHAVAEQNGATVVEVAGGHHAYVNEAADQVIEAIRDHPPNQF